MSSYGARRKFFFLFLCPFIFSLYICGEIKSNNKDGITELRKYNKGKQFQNRI